MDKRLSAFFSYSWDGIEHENWVMNLANKLRSNGGVDATLDKFELYDKTVNLNQMMVQAIRDYDYVIVVLTEGYAKKANDFQGGVGFESELLLSELRRNKDKIILIMRHQGNFESVFPFHLRDYYAIDFSSEQQFENKLRELIRRIYRANPFQKAPLGEIPRFDTDTPTISVQSASDSILSDFKIPSLKRFTDLDREEHLKSSYTEMKQFFIKLFDRVKSLNSNFEYIIDEESKNRYVFKLYVDGSLMTGVKMWIGGLSNYSSPSINFSYGLHHSISDNSMNEMVYCEVKNDQLILKMVMSMNNREDCTTPEKIVKAIWEEHLVNSLKM